MYYAILYNERMREKRKRIKNLTLILLCIIMACALERDRKKRLLS